MQDKTKIQLHSTEVAGLWNTYYIDSLAVCFLKHFLKTLHDEEIRHIIEHALNIANGHIQIVTEKFKQEGLPVPIGFNDHDVDTNAPKLYTDPFISSLY
ncbi:MAG: DUF3231 family protein [Desulfitobacteriaceae bacterium]|nr:DUF3231 family protein [Desulfitobacteriaceae bacterium]MDD4347049.1 DUF3231 family protein [Desulfitobacteriaceae bacterium]MDD4402324.1 DUF3231 family protein [Desulfitobacteriaceae bacterium]